MDDLFGKVGGTDDNSPPEDGVNPYELPHLPEEERRVLQVILRHGELIYQHLAELISREAGLSALSAEHLDHILEKLSSSGYVSCLAEGEELVYRANLRRKSGRNLTIRGIWDVLDAASEAADGGGERKQKIGNLMDRLMSSSKERDQGENPPPANPSGKQMAADIFRSARSSDPLTPGQLTDSLFGKLEDSPDEEAPDTDEPR